jgi:poly(hydroxyalkanoate) granule-associated protein
MAKKERREKEVESLDMTSVVKRLILAGIGAMALTKDEVDEFLDKLVERGEIAEKDARSILKEALARQRERAEEMGERLKLEEKIEEVLDRMNLPKKEDIEELQQRIVELSRKLDTIREEQLKGKQPDEDALEAIQKQVQELSEKIEAMRGKENK